MYKVAVVGDNVTARAALLACQKAGFGELNQFAPQQPAPGYPALTLSANLSRLVQALVGNEAFQELIYTPDREQVRFGRTGYLLSELPLGKFSLDRYHAPHVNITQTALLDLLHTGQQVADHAPLSELEQNHALVLMCEPPNTPKPSAVDSRVARYNLWYSELPFDAGMAKANITWLNGQQTAWQFGSHRAMHFYWALPENQALAPHAWHPQLHEAVAEATLLHTFEPQSLAVPEEMTAGHVAYLGEGVYAGNIYLREALALGLEDAWVISRMMENYEEDIADGLSEYQKYRRPRVRKVQLQTQARAALLSSGQTRKQIMRNLYQAFSTRFMPEIAMHKIDWLYQYDCIRGFR